MVEELNKEVTYRYVPFLRGTKDIDVAYEVGVSMPTLLKLKANSRPSYSTLKKFYDAGYDVMQSFINQD